MKKKIQLIDNRVLVEGDENELLKNEALVTKNERGKVSIKEIIDGVLTEVTESYVNPIRTTFADYILSKTWYDQVKINAAKGDIYDYISWKDQESFVSPINDCIHTGGITVDQNVIIVDDGTLANPRKYGHKVVAGSHNVGSTDSLYGVVVGGTTESPTYTVTLIEGLSINDFKVPSTTVLSFINEDWTE